MPLFTAESYFRLGAPLDTFGRGLTKISVGPTDIVNGDYVRHTNPKFLDNSAITLRGGDRLDINLPAGTGNIAGFSTHSVTHPLQNAS